VAIKRNLKPERFTKSFVLPANLAEDSESHARHTLDSLSSSWTENCVKRAKDGEKNEGARLFRESVLSSTQIKIGSGEKELQG